MADPTWPDGLWNTSIGKLHHMYEEQNEHSRTKETE